MLLTRDLSQATSWSPCASSRVRTPVISSDPLIPHTKQPNRVQRFNLASLTSSIVAKRLGRGCAVAKNSLAVLHNPPIHGCVVADALSLLPQQNPGTLFPGKNSLAERRSRNIVTPLATTDSSHAGQTSYRIRNKAIPRNLRVQSTCRIVLHTTVPA